MRKRAWTTRACLQTARVEQGKKKKVDKIINGKGRFKRSLLGRKFHLYSLHKHLGQGDQLGNTAP
ncbi:MAG: hypothetical protein BRC36_10235 [Cyanobacteria bacterium QH_2_48_84]|nr:MAG: hypothetical protein BRC36_10235 [Cyanobacteria bacterium QH_2_48_84]